MDDSWRGRGYFMSRRATRFQLENAVGEDIDHVGIRKSLLEGLGAVIEVHVPMNVVGRTPLLQKTAESLETTMRRIGPVVDITRRGVADEQIESVAVPQPIQVEARGHLLGHEPDFPLGILRRFVLAITRTSWNPGNNETSCRILYHLPPKIDGAARFAALAAGATASELLGVVPEHVIDRPVQRIGDELEVAGRQVPAAHDQRDMPQALPQRCAVDAGVSFVSNGKNRDRHRYRRGGRRTGQALVDHTTDWTRPT